MIRVDDQNVPLCPVLSRYDSGAERKVPMSDRKQATAIAHPNIALVKYWRRPTGAEPARGRFVVHHPRWARRPRLGSSFNPAANSDRFVFAGRAVPAMLSRVSACLDDLRRRVDVTTRAVVESDNDFPTAAGPCLIGVGFRGPGGRGRCRVGRRAAEPMSWPSSLGARPVQQHGRSSVALWSSHWWIRVGEQRPGSFSSPRRGRCGWRSQ